MCTAKQWILLSALAAGLALASPVAAQTPAPAKKKQMVTRSAAPSAVPYRGTDKFPAGPLYHGNDWLGDDPDPFIRLQIQRDLTARYGGNF
ncbi:MAG TPA: hypothetical protein VNK48_02985 [Xanthobacteraceae bacterium]|nr:hypothetical protein [Xanthobacteraceae bacterium]